MGKKKKGMEVKERWWMNNKRMKETPPLPSPPGFACSPAPSSWKCSQCSWMPEAARGKENQGWKGQGSTGSRKVNKSIFGSIAAIKYRAKRNTKNIHPLDPGPKSFSSFQPCDRAKVRPWASALSFTNHKTHDRPRCPYWCRDPGPRGQACDSKWRWFCLLAHLPPAGERKGCVYSPGHAHWGRGQEEEDC